MLYTINNLTAQFFTIGNSVLLVDLESQQLSSQMELMDMTLLSSAFHTPMILVVLQIPLLEQMDMILLLHLQVSNVGVSQLNIITLVDLHILGVHKYSHQVNLDMSLM